MHECSHVVRGRSKGSLHHLFVLLQRLLGADDAHSHKFAVANIALPLFQTGAHGWYAIDVQTLEGLLHAITILLRVTDHVGQGFERNGCLA